MINKDPNTDQQAVTIKEHMNITKNDMKGWLVIFNKSVNKSRSLTRKGST